MEFKRRIYRLSPRNLSAETIAVTFAKTSRSPEPFDQIAAELDEERSTEFSEKWIVGYGHSSVAEHAVLHLALENVSRLAIETIESNRLASYTEKSTRYQQWDVSAFVIPPEIRYSPFAKSYEEYLSQLFVTYAEILDGLLPWGLANTERKEGESERAWQNRARVKAVDVARFVLPAASMANVGLTINARALEYAIRKMLSSELMEVRLIGEELKQVATEELPTLVKYAEPIGYLPEVTRYARQLSADLTDSYDKPFQLNDVDPEGEDKILAAVLYRFGKVSFQNCLTQVKSLSQSEKQAIVDKLFEQVGKFDSPLRELEYADATFDLIMDQGAYFEFKRHRMMTQTVQDFSIAHGYAIPLAITEAGLEEKFVASMDEIARLYKQIAAWNPQVAAYVLPNAFNRRVMCQANLRSLFHFIKLRTASNAHFSIRRVAYGILELLRPHYPIFAEKILAKGDLSSDEITTQYFSRTE
ncbi:MAG: FAD-dependent thymidylate synthase [Anaerolineaceae bacterium]|jgi:thymidylate synthase ThyX|nr:FAD-dependent thymidylate synthase [Anaerolineaceae bacterium]MDD4043179.1 FAD-dependent thymidylate synthase [Anaerolineaceae bacterium]MDD4578640.1 FAD-dependent thymidylate synthase [Anaerolineaceae bacterium]